ncbi:MAG: NHL repeat-containing protein [Planctomycetes bacterium]|nr:NHL repeat-containing protein [Planctomycetota bacterium]
MKRLATLLSGLFCAVVVTCCTASAQAADFQYPLAVAAGPDGAIYVADKDAHGIWKIAGGKLTSFYTGSNKFRTPLNAVRCVAVDAKGRVLAGDSSTREVYRFTADGKPEPLTKGGIGIPMAIAFNSKGEILVCDLEIHQIVKVPEDGGEPVRVIDVARPSGIVVDSQDRVWVVDSSGKNQIIRILAEGNTEPAIEGKPFGFPHNIALDKEQNAYVCDNYSGAVWKVPVGGKAEKWLEGKPLVKPVGITFTGEKLLIADPHAKQIFEATLDGKIAPVPFEPAAK